MRKTPKSDTNPYVFVRILRLYHVPYLLTGGGAKQFYCCFRASRPWGFTMCRKVAWPRSLQKNDYFIRALTWTPRGRRRPPPPPPPQEKHRQEIAAAVSNIILVYVIKVSIYPPKTSLVLLQKIISLVLHKFPHC